jgi:hypothetical protein
MRRPDIASDAVWRKVGVGAPSGRVVVVKSSSECSFAMIIASAENIRNSSIKYGYEASVSCLRIRRLASTHGVTEPLRSRHENDLGAHCVHDTVTVSRSTGPDDGRWKHQSTCRGGRHRRLKRPFWHACAVLTPPLIQPGARLASVHHQAAWWW